LLGLLAQVSGALVPRERLALGSLGVFLLLVVLYVLLWQPAQQHLLSARSAFEAQRELNAYLHSQAPAACHLLSSPQQTIDPARLQGTVTATSATQGLTIERLGNGGDGTLQPNLQPAPFVQLLRWFTVLQEQGCKSPKLGWIVPRTIRWLCG
jgi:general secretion pathway protein M